MKDAKNLKKLFIGRIQLQPSNVPLHLAKQTIHSLYLFNSSLNFKPRVDVSLTIKSLFYKSRHKPHKHALIDQYNKESKEMTCLNKAQYKDYMLYSMSNEENAQDYMHEQVIKKTIQFNSFSMAPLELTWTF